MPEPHTIAVILTGVVVQALYDDMNDLIIRRIERSITRPFLDHLDATINRVTPLLAHVDKLSEDSPWKVIQDLKRSLEKAVSTVTAFNADLTHRNLFAKYRYKKILKITTRKLVKMDVQLKQWADIKEPNPKMSKKMSKLIKIIDIYLSFIE